MTLYAKSHNSELNYDQYFELESWLNLCRKDIFSDMLKLCCGIEFEHTFIQGPAVIDLGRSNNEETLIGELYCPQTTLVSIKMIE